MHIDTYRQLSRGNRYAVDKLTDSLLTVQRAEECRDIRQLPFYDRKLAAGIGDPTEFEDKFTPLFLYADKIDSRADCVFGVNGDSMEPAYHDGDLVLVERIPDGADLKEGETGAFIIGNETYIKNLGKDGLHSLNPDYKTIRFHDHDIVYLIGRVLSILDPDKDIARPDDVEKYMAIHGDR
jgi:phage repressor protein C with HTH and peptisase S24 domain